MYSMLSKISVNILHPYVVRCSFFEDLVTLHGEQFSRFFDRRFGHGDSGPGANTAQTSQAGEIRCGSNLQQKL